MMLAAKFASPEVVGRLLDAVGSVDLRSREGKSAFDFAKESGWKESVYQIERHGGAGASPAPASPSTLRWPILVEGDEAIRTTAEVGLWAFIHAMNRRERESGHKFKSNA